MINESARGSDFRKRISPHLEVLMQFSLSLTKNGRDATRLMREALAEAYRSWDELTSKDSCDVWLHNILTGRFFNGFQRHSRPLVPILDDNVDDSLLEKNRLFDMTTTDPGQKPFLADEADEDVNYLGAVANLPSVFRTAMILSYLEGFTNKEIANLAGVQPHVIESLLNRGRALLREELFAHLMGNNSLDTFAERAVAAG